MIIVNGFQLLTIITKHPILDVAAVLEPPLASIFVAALRVVRRKIYFIGFIKSKFNFYTLRFYYEIFKTGFVAIFDITMP